MDMGTIKIAIRTLLVAAVLLTPTVCNGQQQRRPATDTWVAGSVVEQSDIDATGLGRWFTIDTISDQLLRRMKEGKTWKANTPAWLRRELRYLRMLHKGIDGRTHRGEMVVNKRIAERTLRIFRKLYEADYMIERIMLMDEYGADDETAMRANNTSSFNFRFKSNSNSEISKHGYGLAIDLNTLYNPYVKVTKPKMPANYNYGTRLKGYTYDFEPATGEPYAFDRARRNDIPMKIDTDDLAYKLFTAEGFRWGGNWRRQKDYQHFEMP